MKWIALVLVAAALVGTSASAAATAAPARRGLIACPPKVSAFVAKLTTFEVLITNGRWSWPNLQGQIAAMVVAEKHIPPSSIPAPCLRNVMVPAGQALIQYSRGVAIAVGSCEYKVCDQNHRQQINRAWTLGNRSTDRAASNLP